MKNELINFIIPVYNTPIGYLSDCLDSILNLKYGNIRILVVDDGSSNSGDIRHLIEGKHSDKLEYVHKNNTGVSDTRNLGISMVKDGFICFVDSDDLIDTNNFDCFLKETDFPFDLACFQNAFITPNGKRKHTKSESNHGVVWAKLFRASIIKENNIKFNIEMKYGEDTIFMLDFKKQSNSVIEYKDCIYLYRPNNFNTTHRYNPNVFEDFNILLLKMKEDITTDELALLTFSFLHHFIFNCCVYHKQNKMTSKEKKALVDSKLADQSLLFGSLISHLSNTKMGFRTRVAYALFKMKQYRLLAFLSKRR